MKLFLYILVMAVVTYFVRMAPFVFFRKKITSPFLQSFLYYTPYAVLGAMTIPGIFYSTGEMIPAAAGFVVGAILAYKGRSLLTVALAACVGAYLAQLLMGLL